MSSIASSTVPTTKYAVCFRKIYPKSVTFPSTLTRSSSTSRLMLSSLSSSSSAKLLNFNNGSSSSSSSSPKLFRPVMQLQDVTVKMVVDAPAPVAFKLYEDRELFPKWMPFLSSVEEMEGRPNVLRYLVKFESFGHNIEYHFLAKSLQPIPNRKLHWRSIEGFKNEGSVRFFPRSPSSCLVEINFSFEVPHALAPVAFAMKPFMEKLIHGGLEHFAAYVKTI